MSDLLVFNRVYRLEIQSVMLVFSISFVNFCPLCIFLYGKKDTIVFVFFHLTLMPSSASITGRELEELLLPLDICAQLWKRIYFVSNLMSRAFFVRISLPLLRTPRFSFPMIFMFICAHRFAWYLVFYGISKWWYSSLPC